MGSFLTLSSQPSNDPQVADNYDEETLRSIAPEAFGPQGFDPLRAQLLITGHFVPPDVASALRARSTEVNSRRVSRLPIANPASGSNGGASAAATEKPSDRAKWTEERTETLIRLHAERVSFKDITVSTFCCITSERLDC